jgi:hypothetical protein
MWPCELGLELREAAQIASTSPGIGRSAAKLHERGGGRIPTSKMTNLGEANSSGSVGVASRWKHSPADNSE